MSEHALCKDHVHRLGSGYLVPNPMVVEPTHGLPTYVECWPHAVCFVHEEQQQCSLVLKGMDGNSALVVQIGYPEACSIYQAMKKAPTPTPPAHQLMEAIITSLGGSVISAVVEAFNPETQAYQCHLTLQAMNGPVNVACRGSDAVALALFASFPIQVNRALMGTALGLDSGILK